MKQKLRRKSPKAVKPYSYRSIIHQLRSWNANYIAFAVFAVLVAMFYGNSISNGFIHDEHPVIEQNPYVQDLRYLPKVVTGCIWESTLGGCAGKTLHYRPIQSLSYLLTWQISSQPWMFHLVHILYFFAAVFLVFLVAKAITQKFRIAFFAGLLFLIHPIHFENANWIAATPEVTFAIFTLLSVLFYIRYRREGSVFHFGLAALFYFLAMLAKEAAVLLPVVLVALDLFIIKKPMRELLRLKEIKQYLLFGIPAMVYFGMRTMVLGGLGGLGSTGDYLSAIYSLPERIYTYTGLFAQYLGKIFFPYPVPMLFLDSFQIRSDLLSPQFLGSFLVVIVYVAGFVFFVKKGYKLFSFSLIWFAVFLLTAILAFKVAGEKVLAERYLFVPSMGFVFIFGYVLNHLWEKYKKARIIIPVFLVALVLTSWVLVFPRNTLWRDDVTLFKAIIAYNPDAYPVRLFLGNKFREAGDMEAAKNQWEEIVRRNPDWRFISQVYNNLGQYYQQRKELDRAQEYFEQSVATSDRIGNYKSYNNLGALHLEKGENLKALTNFCRALQINPTAPEPQSNFNRVVSMIYSVEDAQYIFLYQDVMLGSSFTQAKTAAIEFKRRSCAYGTCLHSFSLDVEEGEILFPFLIMAKAFPQEIIRISQAEFDPFAREITLAIDEQFSNRLITFSFPVCSGVRYDVQVSP